MSRKNALAAYWGSSSNSGIVQLMPTGMRLCLTGQHHILAGTRHEPWQQRGIQFVRPLGALHARDKAWIDEQFWLVDQQAQRFPLRGVCAAMPT